MRYGWVSSVATIAAAAHKSACFFLAHRPAVAITAGIAMAAFAVQAAIAIPAVIAMAA